MYMLIGYAICIAIIWQFAPTLWKRYQEYNSLKELRNNIDNANLISKGVDLKKEADSIIKNAKDKNNS